MSHDMRGSAEPNRVGRALTFENGPMLHDLPRPNSTLHAYPYDIALVRSPEVDE